VEAGFKSQWLQNSLRVNACIFKMKYRDKQELVNNSLMGILVIVNADKAGVAGGELEVAYKAAPWLDLSASYASLDGHYNRFVVGTVNNSGNPLSNSPRNQYSAAANVSIPVSFGYVVGAASYAWKDTSTRVPPTIPILSYLVAGWPTCLPASSRKTGPGVCLHGSKMPTK
jgi:iron complex outermembrane receptor protein